ncbi:YlbL family protein [Canibacter zhoujuaniae]|uniref:YlbL family protein n=1 Tax=Canibacter zhoujuaniae TaxID=2708343 RepID=UPI001423FFF9|nr:S16 family serine protease [Canibacter zhoujuaniae]
MNIDDTPTANGQRGQSSANQQPLQKTRKRSRKIYWAAGVVVFAVLAAVTPVDYVVERPGIVLNTLGELNSGEPNAKHMDFVQVKDAADAANTGAFNLVAVNSFGNPSSKPTLASLIPALLDPAQDIVPMSQIYPENTNFDDYLQQQQAAMTSAQQTAAVAALNYLGANIPVKFEVAGFFDNSKFIDLLKEGDQILTVNGKPVTSAEQISQIINSSKQANTKVEVLRAGEKLSVTAETVEVEGRKLIGIFTKTNFDAPEEVAYAIEDIGGPSAGAVFALAVLDKKLPEDLTHGHNITVTGTVDTAGTIGAIGGLKQKIYAAQRKGSDLMLFPVTNCRDLPQDLPAGITLRAVKNLDEALTAIRDFANGVNADSEILGCEV